METKVKLSLLLMICGLVSACAFDPEAFSAGVAAAAENVTPQIPIIVEGGPIGLWTGVATAVGAAAAGYAGYERHKRKKAENGR